MKDMHIISTMNSHAELKEAVIQNHLAMTQELVLMRTRIEAMQQVLVGNRFSLFWIAIVAMFSPAYVKALIQKAHVQEINLFNAEMQKAKAKPKLVTPPLIKP